MYNSKQRYSSVLYKTDIKKKQYAFVLTSGRHFHWNVIISAIFTASGGMGGGGIDYTTIVRISIPPREIFFVLLLNN